MQMYRRLSCLLSIGLRLTKMRILVRIFADMKCGEIYQRELLNGIVESTAGSREAVPAWSYLFRVEKEWPKRELDLFQIKSF